jgi:hypothetical protein
LNPKTKLTPELIEDMVESFTWTLLPSGKSMVCEAILNNGHAVHGIASVTDPENFNEEIGKVISKKRCLDAVGNFAAYEMHSKIRRIKIGFEPNTLGLKLEKLPCQNGSVDCLVTNGTESLRGRPGLPTDIDVNAAIVVESTSTSSKDVE